MTPPARGTNEKAPTSRARRGLKGTAKNLISVELQICCGAAYLGAEEPQGCLEGVGRHADVSALTWKPNSQRALSKHPDNQTSEVWEKHS